MPFCCTEKTFKLLGQAQKVSPKFAQKVTPKLAQKATTKLAQRVTPNLHKEVTAKLRQNVGETPPKRCVRNRDFVEFKHF